MERSAFKAVMASLVLAMLIVFASSCGGSNSHQSQQDTIQQSAPDTSEISQDTTSVVVVDITKNTAEYEVLITTQTNNTVKNGATGAIIGGIGSYLLGGSALSGAVVGGTAGAALSGPDESHSYYETRYRTTYTVTFSDGTSEQFTDWLPYSIGMKKRVTIR